jgi:hypothetical protein
VRAIDVEQLAPHSAQWAHQFDAVVEWMERHERETKGATHLLRLHERVSDLAADAALHLFGDRLSARLLGDVAAELRDPMHSTTFNDIWPVLSFVLQIVLGLIAWAFARYIAGLVKDLTQQIRIAILELETRISDKYATKDDVRRVEEQVKLSEQMKVGFNQTFALLSARGDGDVRPTPAGVRS